MTTGPAWAPGIRVLMGPWCVEVRGLSAELGLGLCRHYARFAPPPGQPADVVCEVAVTGTAEGPGPQGAAGDQVLVSRPGLHARWDRARSRVELRMAGDLGVMGIDYTLRTLCAHLAFDAGGLLVHGAGIVRGGRAFLFIGPSGAGKTTLARLSTNARVLNDDLVVLWPASSQWTLMSTPFWNPTQVEPQPGQAPLCAVFRLRHGSEPSVASLRPGIALAELLRAVPVVTADPEQRATVIGRCRSTLELTLFAELSFSLLRSGWEKIEQTLEFDPPGSQAYH